MELDSNVRSLWHFNDGGGQNAADSSINANNGTLGSTTDAEANDPTWTTSGKHGNALSFDGIDDYIGTSLDIAPSAFTLEGWVKANDYSSVDNFTGIFGKRQTVNEWRFGVNSTGKLAFLAWNSSNALTLNLTGNTSMSTGSWYYIAATFDGTNLVFYLNGNNDGSTSLSAGAIKNSTDPIRLGTDSLGANRFYDGVFDEVRISDIAKSSTNISNYYSEASNYPKSAMTFANTPSSPSASATSTSQINLNWSSGGVQDHYHVKSSLDSYASNIYNSTGTSTSQSSLTAGTQYTYRIYGVNADDVQSSSYASVSKYTLSDPPTLPVATDGTYADKINVSWTSSLTADHYNVYKDGVSGSGTLVYNSTGTSFDDTTTGSHTYYIYSVNGDDVENSSYISDGGSTAEDTISGTVYTDEGTINIGSGKTVRLLKNGSSAGTATTDSNGAYSIDTNVSAADKIIAYIDGDTSQGTTITVSNGSSLSSFNVYKDHLITRKDNLGALTNADMNTAKGAYLDSDILYSVSGSDLTVSGTGTELYIPSSHTFTPGGNVTTTNVKVIGILTGGSNTFNVSGDWDSSAGTFNSNTSNVILAGSGILKTAGAWNSFYDLNAAAANKTTILQTTTGIANTLTLGTGAIDGSTVYGIWLWKGSGSPFVNSGATITLERIVYVNSGGSTVNIAGGNYGTLSGYGMQLYNVNSNGTYNIGGNITLIGEIRALAFDGTTGNTINTQNYSVTATGSQFGDQNNYRGAWALNAGSSAIDLDYYGLYVKTNAGSHTLNLGSATITNAGPWTLSNGSGTITQEPGTSTVTFDSYNPQEITGSATWNNLEIFNTTASPSDSFDVDPSAAQTVNGTLTVTDGQWSPNTGDNYNNVSIGANGIIKPDDSASISVSGNWLKNASGTFMANSGTVIFNGAGGSTQTLSGNSTFNNFTASATTARTINFESGSATTMNGAATFQGADGQLLSLRSSSTGTRYNLNLGSSATKSFSYLDVKDSDASGSAAALKPINPSNSTNSNNNLEWFNPAAPTAGTPSALSVNSIRWYFS